MPQVYNTHDFVTHDCTPDMFNDRVLNFLFTSILLFENIALTWILDVCFLLAFKYCVKNIILSWPSNMAIVDVCLHSHELSTACVINWICKRSAAYIEDAGNEQCRLREAYVYF